MRLNRQRCRQYRLLLWLWMFCLPAVCAAPSPEIQIVGGSSELRDNIRQYLRLAEERCSAPLWRLQSLLGDAEDEITQASQALGYYHLTFTSKLTQTHDCWQLQLALTPGEAVTVSHLSVVIQGEGVDDSIFSPLAAPFEIKIGDKLNHARYQDIKNRIVNMASSHGYFDGGFEVANIVVNLTDNSAHIDIIFNTGPRYRFGEIRISHHILDEGLLRRYLNINSGDVYDTDQLLELKSIYNATNYFNVASVSPDIQSMKINRDGDSHTAAEPDTSLTEHLSAAENVQPPHTVAVDVVLEERKRRAYSYGLGVATDTGPRILFGFEDRYVNDSGHSIKADLSTSKIKTNALIAYSIPMRRPFYEKLKIYSGYEKENTDTSDSHKNILGVSYSYYQQNKWLHTYAIDYENESSRIGDTPFVYSNLIIPSVSFLRKQTEGNPYPLAGWSLLGKLSGSPKTLGSDLSFIQFDARAKYIHALPVGRVLLRAEVGITQGDDFDKLPASKRYFAGGDTSVRGYAYKSLGPKTTVDGKDIVIGGNSLLVSSIEYDYLVRPRWALATFYDIGNATDNFTSTLKRSAGIGLRWISPIGPVRIDYARALTVDDSVEQQKGWAIHLTMGPDL